MDKIDGALAIDRRVSVDIYAAAAGRADHAIVEALPPIRDKDRCNQTPPSEDRAFTALVDNPELSRILDVRPIIDLRSIFMPDPIRVDLTSGLARLAGQSGFNPLSVSVRQRGFHSRRLAQRAPTQIA